MAKKEKKVRANLKMRIPAGNASPAPPVGSTLGQYGINMMDFIQPFNEETEDLRGNEVGVKITIYEDRSLEFEVTGVPTDELIRNAIGIEKGSGEPHKDKVGTITKSQLKEIAKQKIDRLNTDDLDQAAKIIGGTARSMGVEVDWDN